MAIRSVVTLILLLLFFSLYANGDYIIPNFSIGKNGALNISTTILNNSNFKGEPSYHIEAQTNSNRLNLGDKYTIRLFISGAGDVNLGKMRIDIPSYIVRNNYVALEEFAFNFNFSENRQSNMIPYTRSEKL